MICNISIFKIIVRVFWMINPLVISKFERTEPENYFQFKW